MPYSDHLRRNEHSVYTVTCFLSDLRLLTEYLGRETPLRAISRQMLADWRVHLRMDRGTRPAAKTMSRRGMRLETVFGLVGGRAGGPAELVAPRSAGAPAPRRR